MATTIKPEQLAATVMKEMEEYAGLAVDVLKKEVKAAGQTAKKEISANAPKKSGAYAKSWIVKTMKENSNSIEVVVHSKNRYQLAHLLEHGHAKRGGGRTRAFPHIAPAEANAIDQLEKNIKRELGG